MARRARSGDAVAGHVRPARDRPEQAGAAVLAGVVGALAVLLWWLFFSRARWAERLGAIAVMVVAVAAHHVSFTSQSRTG